MVGLAEVRHQADPFPLLRSSCPIVEMRKGLTAGEGRRRVREGRWWPPEAVALVSYAREAKNRDVTTG